MRENKFLSSNPTALEISDVDATLKPIAGISVIYSRLNPPADMQRNEFAP